MPGARLQIIGDGPLKNKMKMQAADLNHVEFLGIKSKKEIKRLLSAAWIFCTPSIVAESGDAEGLGMVFLEAQALETPVVSFNTGGVGEAVSHEKTGIIVSAKDVEALADAMLRLLKDETLRRKFGKAGVKRIRAQFNIRKQGEKLENIYRDVISKTGS